MIAHSGIKTKGTAVDKVPLTQIEEMIARNGFVERVDAYVTYDGVLHVDISQRRPLVRLLVDGVDSYVTAEGYVFAAPRASSLYVPVVTGSYRPPFPAGYAGSVRAHIDTESAKVDKRIAELEREKYPLYRRELQNDRNLSALRRMRVKKQWWRLESSAEFDKRVGELRRHKVEMRRKYRYEARMIQEGIDRIARQQEAERLKQKKVGEKLRRFHETPYLCRVRRRGRLLEVGSGADCGPDDPQRSVGGGTGAAERTPHHSFRAHRAGGA